MSRFSIENLHIFIFLFVFSAFFLIFVTGCQPEQMNSEDFYNGLQDRMRTGELNINLGEVTPDSCFTDSSVDACIFLKNPVAQNQAALSDHLDITDILRGLQTHGVHINNTLVQLRGLYTDSFGQPFEGERYAQELGFQDNDSIVKLEEVKLSDQNSIIIGLQPHGISGLTASTNFPVGQRNFVDTSNIPNEEYDRNALEPDEGKVFLQNHSYDVTLNYDGIERAFRREDGSWKFEYGISDHSVVQVMTYYYLMHQMKWMQENGGGWYALHKNIKVIALDEDVKNNAYWNPLENTIGLGFVCESNLPFQILRNVTCDFKMEVGLSAEITLHEAGHANFHHSRASQFTASEEFCRSHTNCAGVSICQAGEGENSVCCSDTKGCLLAIDEGQADFHLSVIFPDAPQIGESIVNDINGLKCPSNESIHRNPETNRDATNGQMFYQCDQNAHGGVYSMGMLYSSIWWSLYTHPSVNQQEIMNLFTNHLPLVTSDDNFETAGRRILNLDGMLYSGKYSSIITSEFEKRGLTPQFNVINTNL